MNALKNVNHNDYHVIKWNGMYLTHRAQWTENISDAMVFMEFERLKYAYEKINKPTALIIELGKAVKQAR